jgi:hypothetical protein
LFANHFVPTANMPHNSKKRGAKRYATQISNADETTEAAPEITYKLHPADVLFGRSSFRVHYRGNVRFRQLVRAKKVEYMGTGHHRQKDGVAREILAMIHSQQGRFLRKLETPEKAPKVSGQDRTAWVVVDETAALETIKQSLREPEEVEEKDPSASIGLMPDGDQDDRMEGHGYLVEEAQVDGSLGHSVTVATNGDDLVSQEDAPTPAPHVQGSIVSLPATLSSPPRLHFYPEVTGDAVAATLPPTQQHLAEQQYVQLGLIAPGSAGSMPATSIASTSDLLSIATRFGTWSRRFSPTLAVSSIQQCRRSPRQPTHSKPRRAHHSDGRFSGHGGTQHGASSTRASCSATTLFQLRHGRS